MEEKLKEDLEKFKISKEKNNKKKKIITIIAVLVILFLGVNTFATTQGYDNIFFIIRNLVSPESSNSKDEILSDRDITISYQPIKIFRDLSIQINKLVVEDDEATLYVDVTNDAPENEIENYVVYDITDGKKELIGNHIATNTTSGRYVEKIKLANFTNNTKTIQLEMFDKNHNKISALEINLDKKEINILTATEKEVEKVSEIELKEFLSKVVRFNFYKDKDAITKYHTEQEYKDEMKVVYALEILDKEKASFDEVHKVIKEITGEDIKDSLSIANVVAARTNDGYKYVAGKDSHQAHALCLQISDIKFLDGIYTVNCVYSYVTPKDYENNRIENLDKFETTIEFTLNENYEYVKYCLVDANGFEGKLYEENTDIDENLKSDTEIDYTDNNKSENTSNNTVTDMTNNTTNNNDENETSNTTDIIETVKPNYEKIDNYASTMQWGVLYTPGLRTRIPAIWNVEVIDDMYSGTQDDGKVATVVTGLARGINKETNEIIDSNMTIRYYMPEFVNYTNLEDFANSVAQRFGANNTGCGYGDAGGKTTWRILSKGNSEYYCHFEAIDNETQGIGYIVEIETDNFNNYKVTNILNWIFADIKTISF